MSAADVLSRISATLNRAGIGYMLSGSFASAYYGPPRATQDIDIVIAATPDQLRTLVHLLPISQYYVDLDAVLEAHKRQSMFNVIDMATGWKIDFIIRKLPTSLDTQWLGQAKTDASFGRESDFLFASRIGSGGASGCADG